MAPAFPADIRPAIVAPAPTIDLPAPGVPAPGALAATSQPQDGIAALAQDAAEYALHHGVTIMEAMHRLRAQEESVAATDRIAILFQDRLAGISIEHQPVYRIVVLLTGSTPVPDEIVAAGGMAVPIVFRTGAPATRAHILATIVTYRDLILAAVKGPAGLGLDPRSGELVVRVKATLIGRDEAAALSADLAYRTGVPVRIDRLDRTDADMAATGGARVEGVSAVTGGRAACTTGFVVTDAIRTGVITAAHCPYSLTYIGKDGARIPLEYVGAWGARYQDVQVQVSAEPLLPLFYADTAKSVLRPVTSWRNRASTRAGDVVCHRGERTGYSCAEVEMIDYAPPGSLCGGPCDPVWVTVAGPACKAGDSGGPVFSGTTAFGILKGGSYRRDGGCDFYYYMSTDFLPSGWTLLRRTGEPGAARPSSEPEADPRDNARPGPVATGRAGEPGRVADLSLPRKSDIRRELAPELIAQPKADLGV
jgi:hypothetical protein